MADDDEPAMADEGEAECSKENTRKQTEEAQVMANGGENEGTITKTNIRLRAAQSQFSLRNWNASLRRSSKIRSFDKCVLNVGEYQLAFHQSTILQNPKLLNLHNEMVDYDI